MKLGDVAQELMIDIRKLTDYALNPDNPVGADKAKVFEQRLGYTPNCWRPLLRQIQDKALMTEAIPTIHDQHGQRYRVDIDIIGAAAQQAIVRTGWIVEPGTEVARLVTLYVRK